MNTNQPAWFCVANLGDANPLEHGGKFLMIDRRGYYDPELWAWEPERKKLYTIILERCHKIGDEVGDNVFHSNHVAWFGSADHIGRVCSSCGWDYNIFVDALICRNPIEKARAFYDMAMHYGFENFDGDPQTYSIPEARKLINRLMRQIVKADKWPDGLEK